jgi:peptidoglycan/LPS O-acetylase OafA/YrhL
MMNAGEGERARVGRLTLVVGLGAVLCAVAYFAGVPGYWAPLVIGGGLGVLTALVAGAPGREDD